MAPVKKTVCNRRRPGGEPVADGDTVNVYLATGAYRRVRLVGIDTPEVYGGVPVRRARGLGGDEADAAGRRPGQPVSDPYQAGVDRYGRLLRYVSRVADGRQVNRAQVYLGHAPVYVYGGVPFKRTHDFRVAQAAAKAAPAVSGAPVTSHRTQVGAQHPRPVGEQFSISPGSERQRTGWSQSRRASGFTAPGRAQRFFVSQER